MPAAVERFRILPALENTIEVPSIAGLESDGPDDEWPRNVCADPIKDRVWLVPQDVDAICGHEE
jgi:hypothetical protein